MKTLGNKSLSTVLSGIIHVIWWIEWIATIGVIAAIIITPFVKKDVSFTTPITFSAVTVSHVAAARPNFETGQLNAADGNFSFNVQPNLINTLIMLLIVMVIGSFFILATYQLKLIFSSFNKHDPFMWLNTTRLRNFGFIIGAYSLAQLAYNIALNQYLTTHFKFGGPIQLTYSFNFSALFTGVTIIVIAGVFKMGAELDSEQKLTI